MGHEEPWPIEQPLPGPHRQPPRTNGRLRACRYACDEVILPHQVQVSLVGFVQQGKVEISTVHQGHRQVVRHLWPNQNLRNEFWSRFPSPVELRATEPTILRLVAVEGAEATIFASPPRPSGSRAMRDRRQLAWTAAVLSAILLLGLLAWQWQTPWKGLLSRLAYGLASYQLQNGKESGALSGLQAGLDLEPNLARARNDLGYILYRRGQQGEAQAAFELALAADPALSAAHNNLGLALLESGETGPAREELDRAVATDPENAAAWANLGLAERLAGHPEDAIHAYRAALRLNPEDTTTRINLGVLCYEQQQLAEAREHLQAALAADPDLPEAHMILGDIALRQGERERAWEELQAATTSLDGNPVLHFYLALWYEEAEQWKEAERELTQVLALQPHRDLASLARSHLDALAHLGPSPSEGRGEKKGD
jgi:tetratricopeptide (TPR) repeat protein